MSAEGLLCVLEAKANRPKVGTASGHGLTVHVAYGPPGYRYEGPDGELTREEALAFIGREKS